MIRCRSCERLRNNTEAARGLSRTRARAGHVVRTAPPAPSARSSRSDPRPDQAPHKEGSGGGLGRLAGHDEEPSERRRDEEDDEQLKPHSPVALHWVGASHPEHGDHLEDGPDDDGRPHPCLPIHFVHLPVVVTRAARKVEYHFLQSMTLWRKVNQLGVELVGGGESPPVVLLPRGAEYGPPQVYAVLPSVRDRLEEVREGVGVVGAAPILEPFSAPASNPGATPSDVFRAIVHANSTFGGVRCARARHAELVRRGIYPRRTTDAERRPRPCDAPLVGAGIPARSNRRSPGATPSESSGPKVAQQRVPTGRSPHAAGNANLGSIH